MLKQIFTMYPVMNINGNCVYYDHYDAKNNFELLFHELQNP